MNADVGARVIPLQMRQVEAVRPTLLLLQGGALVAPDTVILELSNPELEQSALEARLNLSRAWSMSMSRNPLASPLVESGRRVVVLLLAGARGELTLHGVAQRDLKRLERPVECGADGRVPRVEPHRLDLGLLPGRHADTCPCVRCRARYGTRR